MQGSAEGKGGTPRGDDQFVDVHQLRRAAPALAAWPLLPTVSDAIRCAAVVVSPARARGNGVVSRERTVGNSKTPWGHFLAGGKKIRQP